MRHKSLILLVLVLCTGVASAADRPPRTLDEQIQALVKPPPPRTLDEKVDHAELIVRGKATLFGEEKWVLDFVRTDKAFFGFGNDPLPDNPYLPYTIYQRELRVEVTEVLWPPSLKGITNIVLSCYIVKKWPPSRWAYTNTPGIFFLTRRPSPGNEEWAKLDRYDDWIEPVTHTRSVQAAITKTKGPGARPVRQPGGAADRSQPVRSETTRTSATAGSGR